MLYFCSLRASTAGVEAVRRSWRMFAACTSWTDTVAGTLRSLRATKMHLPDLERRHMVFTV